MVKQRVPKPGTYLTLTGSDGNPLRRALAKIPENSKTRHMKPSLEELGDVLREQVGGALGRAEGGRVWDRHIQDSLTALPLIEGCRRLVDIGSGVGAKIVEDHVDIKFLGNLLVDLAKED